MSMLRYPGSKAKLHHFILGFFPEDVMLDLWRQPINVYCEPFFGSGAIAWKFLPYIAGRGTSVVINDMDPGISALWKSVRDAPRDLVALVTPFKPSPEKFYEFKAADGDISIDPVKLGFQKLALHQMSYSGLGFMSGGPLGGREQRSEYNTSCRWNPVRLHKFIIRYHKLMASFRRFDILCGDFAAALDKVPAKGFVYLDPPYFVRGAELYRHSFSGDHQRLANVLREKRFRWALSYDDCQDIRSLYEGWATIRSFNMTPTCGLSKVKRRKNSEIVVTNY